MMSGTPIFWIFAQLQSTAETFLLLCICRAMFPLPKKNQFLRYSLIFIVAFFYSIFLNLVKPDNTIKLILTICLFTLYTFIFESTFLKRIFVVAIDGFLNTTLSSLVIWGISLFGEDVASIYTGDIFFYITMLLNIMSLTVVALLIDYITKRHRMNLMITFSQWGLILLYPLAAAFVIICTLQLSLQFALPSHYFILISIALIVGMLAHFFLMHLLSEQNAEIEHQLLLEQQMLLEEQKAQALSNAYLQQRQLTHDFTNQLTALKVMLSQNDVPQAQQYLDELLPDVYACTQVVHTGNPLVDAILSEKYEKAASLGLSMRFMLSNLKNIPLSQKDIVVVLSNLLDNALEVATTIPASEIQIKLQQGDNDFVLSVRNRVRETVLIENNMPPPTSKSQPGHGVGLSNVINVLKKYDSTYSISCRNGWFQFTALLQYK